MKKSSYWLFFPIIGFIIGCNNSLTKVEETYVEPRGFWYYSPDFHLDSLHSSLQSDGLYFRIIEEDAFGDNYQLFRFYPDGLVIEYSVYNTPDKVLDLQKITDKNIHGYYTVDQDSLFFTTKVYYDHNPTFYKGRIYADSLVLHRQNYRKKQSETNTFYFYTN